VNFTPDESGADLKQLFFESAQELLHALNEKGLDLEQAARDPELVRSVRRIVHTLKGDSAACGYGEISELAHQLEDVLTPELADCDSARLAELVLTAADVFSAMLAAYRNSTPVPDGKALRRLIEGAAVASPKATASQTKSPEPTAFNWTEYEHKLIADRVSRGEQVLQLRLDLERNCPTPAAAYQLIRNALEQTGEILVIQPEASSGESLTVVEAALATKANLKAVIRKCKIPAVVTQAHILPYAAAPDGNAEIVPTLAPSSVARRWGTSASKAEPAGVNAGSGAPSAAENSLRVDASRIDTLLNLVGELIIGKSMLHQTLSEFGRRFPKDTLRGRFADAVSFQARVLGELQKSVMKIRMVPVEQLFRRFPRVVRDVAKARGREVHLEISGEDTDLDKSILDVLAEPLNHLVRNAVDHGIESPAERAAADKPELGTIRLKAFHQGNQVVIEVSDDGRGIDGEKVRAKALQNKVASPKEIARMSEAEALELIFHPGLSTAEQVTAISGRGVGMDVVKTVLERLKGTVQVESQAGQGTTFYLKVPLTLAIINALLFRVGEKLYAVPLASVVEITRAREEQIHVADQHEVMQLRDDVLTLIRLGKLHDGNGNGGAQKLFVIVTRVGERKFGLVVDKVVGEEELVIKALGDQLVATDLVSGASILGDGSVVLILNLAAVVSRLGRSHGEGGDSRPPAHNEVRA
jgi:two-component system, chemotaxis family, sensor kinase CheA